MYNKKKQINIFLLPLAVLYQIGVAVRNWLFDFGILKSRSFDIPIISIGNLTVGGTGKTPHAEYLIRLLKNQFKVALLSRGYKRETKGYILSTENSTAKQIGDEPCQMKKKFPEIQIAVDANRCEGIDLLCQLDDPKLEVILLDDAYQHRKVVPGVSILLTDYNNLFSDDHMLPAGRLREPAGRKDRADVVIVTKTPSKIKPMDLRVICSKLQLKPFQKLFFSTFTYGSLVAMQDSQQTNIQDVINTDDYVLLLTGIADPKTITEELTTYTSNIELMAFGDHHHYSSLDIAKVHQTFNALKEKATDARVWVITTEKDAARLSSIALPEELLSHMYVLPIEVKIINNEQEIFNQYIINYVRSNKRYGILSSK